MPNPYMKHLPMALYFESEIESNLPQLRANKGTFKGSVVLEEAGKARRKDKRKNKKNNKKSKVVSERSKDGSEKSIVKADVL